MGKRKGRQAYRWSVFIATAEFDPLRNEGEAYAEKLLEAGNVVTVKRYDGQIHGFVTLCGVMEKGKQTIEEAAQDAPGPLDEGVRVGQDSPEVSDACKQPPTL